MKRLPVVAVRIHNPDRSPLRINGRNPAQAPTGLAKSVGNNFPVLHFDAPLLFISFCRCLVQNKSGRILGREVLESHAGNLSGVVCLTRGG